MGSRFRIGSMSDLILTPHPQLIRGRFCEKYRKYTQTLLFNVPRRVPQVNPRQTQSNLYQHLLKETGAPNVPLDGRTAEEARYL